MQPLHAPAHCEDCIYVNLIAWLATVRLHSFPCAGDLNTFCLHPSCRKFSASLLYSSNDIVVLFLILFITHYFLHECFIALEFLEILCIFLRLATFFVSFSQVPILLEEEDVEEALLDDIITLFRELVRISGDVATPEHVINAVVNPSAFSRHPSRPLLRSFSIRDNAGMPCVCSERIPVLAAIPEAFDG